MAIRSIRELNGRIRFVRVATLSNQALGAYPVMYEGWRQGIVLESSEPPWARGSGRKLVWDD